MPIESEQAMAKVTVEFSGKIELDVQGWTDETQLAQVKKQAADEVLSWTIMLKKGATEPVPMSGVQAKVTEVTIPIE